VFAEEIGLEAKEKTVDVMDEMEVRILVLDDCRRWKDGEREKEKLGRR